MSSSTPVIAEIAVPNLRCMPALMDIQVLLGLSFESRSPDESVNGQSVKLSHVVWRCGVYKHETEG